MSLKRLLSLGLLLAGIQSSYGQLEMVYQASTIQYNELDYGFISVAEYDYQDNILEFAQFMDTIDLDPGVGVAQVISTPSYRPCYLRKLDANQNFIWGIRWEGAANMMPTSIATDASGIYLSGYFWGTIDLDPGTGVQNVTTGGMNNIFVIKLDHSGNYIWGKHLNCTGNSYQANLSLSPNGNILVSGTFTGNVDIDPGTTVTLLTGGGGFDGYALELNPAGNYIHHFHIGSTGSDGILNIKRDAALNYYLVGYFAATVDFDPSGATSSMTAVSTDAFLAKYNSSGQIIYSKQFGGSGSAILKSIDFDSPGNLILVGEIGSNSSVDLDPDAGVVNFSNGMSKAMYIARTTSSGAYINHAVIMGGPTNFKKLAKRGNNLYFSGYFDGTVDFDPSSATENIVNGIAPSGNEFILGLDESLNYNGVLITNMPSGSGDGDYGVFGIDINPSETKMLRYGVFGGTYDMNPYSGVDEFTTTQAAYYISELSFCSSATATYNTITEGPHCASYTSPSGTVYTSSGTYTDIIPNSIGCDSVITINLTITQPIVPVLEMTITSDSICQGDLVTFIANYTGGGSSPQVDWYLNGVYYTSGDQFGHSNLQNGDQIYYELTSSETCILANPINSDTIFMTVGNPGGVASIYTSVTPGTSACSNESIVFEATAYNTGNYPVYNWTINGIEQFVNSSTFEPTLVNDGDVVVCSIISSDGCLSNNEALATPITMTITQGVTPEVDIAGPTYLCAGENGTFTATYSGEGSAPIINWFINSSTTPVGTGEEFSSSSLNDGDTVRCVLINNDACAIPNYAISNSIIVNVSAGYTPGVDLGTTATTICEGENVTFTATPFMGGENPIYHWYVLGNEITFGPDSTFTTSGLINGADVQCMLVSNASCLATTSASSIAIVMNVNPTYSTTNTYTVCEGETVTVGGNTYSTTGTYTDVFQMAATGCDSSIITELIVVPVSTAEFTLAACDNYTSPSGLYTWTSSGIYSDTIPNAAGCDSILLFNLTINSTPETLVNYDDLTTELQLQNGSAGYSYQWLDCANEMAPISGANSDTYLITQNGSYAIEVNNNGCVNTSDCYVIDDLKVSQLTKFEMVEIFPNPSNAVISIESSVPFDNIQIIDLTGKVVYNNDFIAKPTIQIPIEFLKDGVYFIQVNINNTVLATTRLVKE